MKTTPDGDFLAPEGQRLARLFRNAASLAADISPAAAVWKAFGEPSQLSREESLWRSFCDQEALPAGNEAILGLLLLAEILETAE